MGLFELIGETIGEIIVAPLTITKAVVDGIEEAIEKLEE